MEVRSMRQVPACPFEVEKRTAPRTVVVCRPSGAPFSIRRVAVSTSSGAPSSVTVRPSRSGTAQARWTLLARVSAVRERSSVSQARVVLPVTVTSPPAGHSWLRVNLVVEEPFTNAGPPPSADASVEAGKPAIPASTAEMPAASTSAATSRASSRDSRASPAAAAASQPAATSRTGIRTSARMARLRVGR